MFKTCVFRFRLHLTALPQGLSDNRLRVGTLAVPETRDSCRGSQKVAKQHMFPLEVERPPKVGPNLISSGLVAGSAFFILPFVGK